MNNKMQRMHIYQQLNLKHKINKQAEQKQIHRQNVLTGASRKLDREMGEKSEGIKKYNLIVTELSWGCKVQHREYSQ